MHSSQIAKEAPGRQPARRLKVWSIITSLTTGGAESLVLGLNRCFADQGLDHTLIALCDAQTVGNSRETEQRMANQVREDGGKFLSLELGRWRDPITGMMALNRLLGDHAPDVIHAHTVRAIPMLGFSRFDGSVVLTHHNSRLSFPKVFFRYIDRVVDSYVAISGETEEIYKLQCRRAVRRISNGVSSDYLSGAERKSVSKPCRIISVGAISDQKNYRLLIATANALKSRASGGPLATFKIAGAGEGLDDLRKEVAGQGLADTVEFLGERSDVPALLADADVFLNTSHYEGQSVAMLEAMAMALPVVATNVPGNCDLISHEGNGLLADHDQPTALADAIMRLVDNPELYEALSKGAREAGQLHSVEKTAAGHIDLYRSLVSKV